MKKDLRFLESHCKNKIPFHSQSNDDDGDELRKKLGKLTLTQNSFKSNYRQTLEELRTQYDFQVLQMRTFCFHDHKEAGAAGPVISPPPAKKSKSTSADQETVKHPSHNAASTSSTSSTTLHSISNENVQPQFTYNGGNLNRFTRRSPEESTFDMNNTNDVGNGGGGYQGKSNLRHPWTLPQTNNDNNNGQNANNALLSQPSVQQFMITPYNGNQTNNNYTGGAYNNNDCTSTIKTVPWNLPAQKDN